MNKRLLQLFAVLAYDSDTYSAIQVKYLTVGQRICINQERAHIMQEMAKGETIIFYDQSQIVEEKIIFIVNKIKENQLSQAYAKHSREHLVP